MLALGAQHATAQITRVGATFVAVNSNTGTGTVPAGTAAGDIMVAAVSVRGAGQAILVPAGWTSVQSHATATIAQRVFYKFAGAAEPGPTFTWTNPDRATITLVSYRNVAAVVLAESGGQQTLNSVTITAPGFNIAVNSSMLVGFFGIADNRAAFSGSTLNPVFGAGVEPGSGAGPNGVRVYVGELLVNPPSTAARQVTSSHQADNIGHMLALRPARSFLVEAFGGGNIGTQIAGTSFNIRITARTPGGVTDTAFNGTVDITSTGTLSAGSGTTANFVNGVLASHTVRIFNTGTFTITATETGAATNSGISNSFLVVPKLQILVPGETANPGSPSGKLGTPLTQTQGIAFNVTVNAVDEGWNLVATATDTVNITSSDGAAVLPPAAALSAGTRNFSVILNTPPNATLIANAVTPARTDTSPSVPIATAGGRFNACNAGAATCDSTTPATYITTKVAGANFSVDIVALKLDGSLDTSYNATVRVELLNASDNSGALDADNCRPTWSPIATLAPDPSFSPPDNGRITVGPLNVANAYRDVRVRITSQTGASRRGCSTDNFAIRPASFAVSVTDATWDTAGVDRALNNTGAVGGNVHKAGHDFTITVTPSPGTATNYDGDPTVSAVACSLPAPCATGTLSLGTFGGSGTRVSSTATYSEAGAFDLTLVDQTFASVDSADGTTADCSATGRYVCQSSAPVAVGRFVPDRFALVGVTPPTFRTFDQTDAACTVPPAGARRRFTYIGQFFGSQTQPVAMVTAQNASGGTTTNYRGALWKLTGASVTQTFANSPVETLDTTQVLAPTVAETPGTGTGTLTGNAAGKLAFTRNNAAPRAPFNSNLSLTWSVSDASETDTGQGTIVTATPLVFNGGGTGIAFDGGDFDTPAGLTGGKTFAYGRLRLGSANGTNLLPLTLRIEAQHWLEPVPGKGYYVTNTADHCTVVATANVGVGNFRGGLVGGDTTPTISPAGPVSSGIKLLTLSAPGGTKTGSVDVVLNLAPSAGAINPCVAFDAPPPTPAAANLAYLRGQWCGTDADRDPVGRARFGSYRGGQEFIYFRENF